MQQNEVICILFNQEKRSRETKIDPISNTIPNYLNPQQFLSARDVAIDDEGDELGQNPRTRRSNNVQNTSIATSFDVQGSFVVAID